MAVNLLSLVSIKKSKMLQSLLRMLQQQMIVVRKITRRAWPSKSMVQKLWTTIVTKMTKRRRMKMTEIERVCLTAAPLTNIL